MKPPCPSVAILIATHIAAAALAFYCGVNFRPGSEATSAPKAWSPGSVGGSGRHSASSLSNLQVGPATADASSSLPHNGLLPHIETTERDIRHLTPEELLGALEDLRGRPTGPEKLFSQLLMLVRLTEIDPTLALGFTATLPTPENQTGELSVLSTWARLDPQAAAAHFAENSSDFGILDARQRAAARTIAEQWALTDPVQAFEWASQLPEEVRLDALAPAIAKLSLNQSDRIIEAINNRDPGVERTEMITQVAAERAHHAPQQTADWAASLSDPEERNGATAAVVARWATQDVRAAATWVRSQSPGSARDSALRSLLESPSFRREPSMAMRWTGSIVDEAVRREAIASIVNRWEVLDPDAAADWTRNRQR